MDADILLLLLIPTAGVALTAWLFLTLFVFVSFLGGRWLDTPADLAALCGISAPIAVGAVVGGLLGLRKKEDRIDA
ncbi:hypothetical protein [Yoonia sp. BS5-3]|uniref:Uncharacterized protein n=1 Tax=Yoonia phaeophyticola TaxID=3137369 RepID=A0ABZ2V2F4_9RHOB